MIASSKPAWNTQNRVFPSIALNRGFRAEKCPKAQENGNSRFVSYTKPAIRRSIFIESRMPLFFEECVRFDLTKEVIDTRTGFFLDKTRKKLSFDISPTPAIVFFPL